MSTMGRGGGGSTSSSLVEAITRQARIFDEPLFDNLVGFWAGVGIFIGTGFAQYIVGFAIIYAWGVNWRRIFGCCYGWGGGGRDRARDHEDDPLFKNPNDLNASNNRPKVLPVKGKFGPNGSLPSAAGPPTTRLNDVVGVTPQQFKEVPVVQTQHDSKLWSGAKPSHMENYVRLSALLARLIVLIAGIMLAFQAAGVNVLSLAASMGIISLCFTWGGANLLRNFLSVMYMHWTCKYSIGMYISLGDKQGLVSAFRDQWTEVVDDLRPRRGRQVHLIPNATMMDADVTIYPDGPPSEIVVRYFAEIKSVNEARATLGLPSLQPIEGFAWGG